MSDWAVEFVLTDEQVKYDKSNKLHFFDWLNGQLGLRPVMEPMDKWRWNVYGCRPIIVCFRNADDAMLFKLTWL